jgi:hypothetical protein
MPAEEQGRGSGNPLSSWLRVVEFRAGIASIWVQEATPRIAQSTSKFERVGHCFVLHGFVCNHKGLWGYARVQGHRDGQCDH